MVYPGRGFTEFTEFASLVLEIHVNTYSHGRASVF